MIIESWKSDCATLNSSDVIFQKGETELIFCYFNDDIMTIDMRSGNEPSLDFYIPLDVEVRFR